MSHGYMREFDERSDRYDSDPNWRSRDDRGRDWRAHDRESRDDPDRGVMFGDYQGRYHPEERQRWREGSPWENDRDGPERTRRPGFFGGGGFARDYRDRRSESLGNKFFSSQPDDHYRSWRQQQIDALDRDYADYCREREQQFHQDFDSWRRDRKGTRAGETAAIDGELELTQKRALAGDDNSAVGEPARGTKTPKTK